MKLQSTLLNDFKNFFGQDILDEKILKSELTNFVLSEINSFSSKNQGSKLIFEVLNYVNKNFSFNSNNELSEIKDHFLNNHKTSILSSLSKSNFKEFDYSLKEFYFYAFESFSVLYYINQSVVYNKLYPNRKHSELSLEQLKNNFKIISKSKNFSETDLKNILSVLSVKQIDFTKNKFFKLLTNCNFVGFRHFLEFRDTTDIRNLNKEKIAISKYFSSVPLNSYLYDFESFLRKEDFEEQDIQLIIFSLNKLLSFN